MRVMHAFAPSRLIGAADHAIAALAAGQFGVVGRSQLLAAGLSEDAVNWRVRAGRLHQIHRGVYLVGHEVAPRLAAEMAAQLACEPDSLVSHASAANYWEMTRARFAAPTDAQGIRTATVDITVVARELHRQPGIRLHRRDQIREADVHSHGPLRVTAPARTLLDLAARLRPADLEAAVAQAYRHRLVTPDRLAEQIAHNRGRRGVARLRLVLDLEQGPAFTRSVAERRFLELVRSASLAAPEVNATVAGHEVDFLWREQRLIVEIDGRAFHSDRRAFERDRIRDAELAAAGYVVVRVTWRQLLDHPDAVLARLRATLRSRS